jgi:GT2 family glycosyltransferase/2-polyprenyl-3-methyl-5-hydroxy-6-metoxy-1,4-benzoquinol methylase
LRELKVSIVIPAYNKVELTAACLQALAKNTTGYEYEVIIVDDCSTDATPRILNTLSGDVKVIRNETNLGFARSCNKGASLAAGEYLIFLNNDTVPLAGWLEPMVRAAQADAKIGAVGSKLLFEDGSIQHAGVVFNRVGLPYHIYYGFPTNFPAVNKRRRFNAVTAACMLVRRELFERLGGFDEGFLNGYEDVDFCLRLRAAGYEILYEPESVLFHFEKQTRGEDSEKELPNVQRLCNKWGSRLPRDDAYYYQEDCLSFYVPMVLRDKPLVKVNYLVCPGCGKEGGEFIEGFGEYDRYHCNNCNLIFAYPMKAKDYNSAYESDDNYCCRENENWWRNRYFEATADRYFLEGYFEIIRSFLKEMAEELPSERRRLLDIGFGDGVFLKMAAEMGFAVSGFEVSKKSLEIARRYVPEARVADNYDELPGPFDVVTILEVLEHVEDPLGLLCRAYELLSPGGYLIIGVPNADNLIAQVAGHDVIGNYPPHHLTLWTEKSLKNLLSKFSFGEVQTGYSLPGPCTLQALFQTLPPGAIQGKTAAVDKEVLFDLLTPDNLFGKMLANILNCIPRNYGATLFAFCRK